MNATRRNILTGVVILAVPIFFQIYSWLKEKPVNNCTSSESSSLIILVDHTGTLSAATRNSIKEISSRAVDGMPAHSMVSVYFLSKDSFVSNPTFQACIPEKKTLATGLTKDEEKVQAKWEEFKKYFFAELASAPDISPQSPIYEVLSDIVRDRKAIREAKQSRLLVFSDFIEYSSVANLHSGCVDPTDVYKKITGSISYAAVDRPLAGMVVERYIIPRDRRAKSYTECVRQVSDMVFNRLGMGPNAKLEYLSRSPAD